MNFNRTYLKGFIDKCASENLTDDQIIDSYIVLCADEYLKDQSFRSGFESVIKQAGIDTRYIDTVALKRVLGTILLSSEAESEN